MIHEAQKAEFKNFPGFLDLLKHLIRRPSVVGSEYPFFLSLKRELDELGIETSLYDGLLVAQGSNPHSGSLSAHIDRHGLVCTGPNEFQYAAFLAKYRGDLTGDSVSEQTYMSIAERFIDQKVQAYEPWSGSYLGLGVIDHAYICERRKNLVFEVKGLEHLMAGTPVAFVDSLHYKDGLLSSQLDNVISAAIIIYLYRMGYQGRAFFTAEEEAGKSWRFLLEWFRRFDMQCERLLVLDTSPYASLDDAKAQTVVLRNRDANAPFESTLLDDIIATCDAMGIHYSFKDRYIEERNIALTKEGQTPYSLGTTELGRLIVASEGTIQGSTLQIPTIGYHTVNETAVSSSVTAVLEILKKLYIDD